MSEHNTRMVLRTVYLPPELDEKLRVFSFRKNVSKNDLIRDALARELASEFSFLEEKTSVDQIDSRGKNRKSENSGKSKIQE